MASLYHNDEVGVGVWLGVEVGGGGMGWGQCFNVIGLQ